MVTTSTASVLQSIGDSWSTRGNAQGDTAGVFDQPPLAPLVAPRPNAGTKGWGGATGSWSVPTAAASVVQADTTVTLAGVPSYTLTTKGDGAFVSANHGARTSFSKTANPDHVLAVWVWVDDPTALKTVTIYASSSSGNSYYWDLLIAAPSADKPTFLPRRWRKFTLSTATANIQGTPVDTALVRTVFNVVDNNVPVTVRLSNRMQWEPTAPTQFPNGAVCFDFDDSYKSVELAMPSLASRGWRASLVPITGVVGSNAIYLSWDDIISMQRNLGWPVKSHCRTLDQHAGFTTLSAADQVAAWRASVSDIKAAGLWGWQDFAYPNGAYGSGKESEPVTVTLRQLGVSSARATQTQRPVETLPPGDRLLVANRSDVGGPTVPISTYTTSTTGLLDRAAAAKACLHLTFHSIIASGTAATNQCTVADFETLCASIEAKGLAVAPTAEVFGALR